MNPEPTTALTRRLRLAINLAEMEEFVPANAAFSCSDPNAFLIEIEFIQWPHQRETFDSERAAHILKAIREHAPMPPVEVSAVNGECGRGTWNLYDGFHRFTLASALGYTHVPAVEVVSVTFDTIEHPIVVRLKDLLRVGDISEKL